MKTFAQILFGLLIGICLLNSTAYAELGWGDRNTQLYFHYPPDPVNNRTLNFFLPVVQLVQPCFSPIEIRAAYNSYSNDSSIFGWKWTFNHNIHVNEAVTHFEITEGDGYINKYTREKNLEEAARALAKKIVIETKKDDAKAGGIKDQAIYDELEKKLVEDKNFREQEAKKRIGTARPLGPGVYYSLSRGQSQLEKKKDGSFVRTFQNGSKEFFNSKGQIVRSEDRNNNWIGYIYQGDSLVRINDMCGRNVNFQYYESPTQKDLVKQINDGLGRIFQYEFDGRKLLTKFTDLNEKKVISYRYDKKGNMLEIEQKQQTGEQVQSEVIKLTYNDKLEVASQSGPDESSSVFKRTFVSNNPNHSITTIEKYKGKALEERDVFEYKVGEYEVQSEFDPAGKLLSKKTKRFSSETGYPESIFDESGQGDKFKYDPENGNLLERENNPSGEKMIFTYEKRCNQVNSVVVTRPNKAIVKSEFKFDPKCNVVDATETTGETPTGHVQVVYQQNGKTQFLKDLLNKKELAFTYWQYGKPESITLKDSGTLLVKYEPNGEIKNVDTFPHGEGKKRFASMDASATKRIILKEVQGSLNEMLALLRPAGLKIGL